MHNYIIKINRDIQRLILAILILFFQIQQATFYISKQAEFEVLKSKTAEIESQNEKLQQEVEQLKVQYEKMDKSTDSKMKSIRGLVEQESSQREKDIEKLKGKIKLKEQLITEVNSSTL